MRGVTDCTAFHFRGRVLVNEWSLLVRVALHARRIRSGVKPRLLHLESTVRIMAIAALHRPLEDSVMKRLCELAFHLGVTSHAQLRFSLHEHFRWGQVVRVRRKWANRK